MNRLIAAAVLCPAVLWAAAAPTAASAGAPPAAAANVRDSAVGVVEAFHAALKAGDAAAAAALMDQHATVFESGHVERSRAEYAAGHLPADIQFTQATTYVRTARHIEISDEVAVVTSEGTITGTFNGKPVDSISIETIVLRHSPDGWKIVHIHWSSRKPPAAPAPPAS